MSETLSEMKPGVRTGARECAGSGTAVTAVIGQDGRPLGARAVIDASVRHWDQHPAASHQDLAKKAPGQPLFAQGLFELYRRNNALLDQDLS